MVDEKRHLRIPEASDADLLRYLMEAAGVAQMQLPPETGFAQSGISEVLAGTKPFSKQRFRHARRLPPHTGIRIPDERPQEAISQSSNPKVVG